MKQAEPTIRVIDYVTRQKSSVNGNPAFMVYFTDGSSSRTKSDSSCAYEIENLTHSRYKGREVAITFTKAGRIETITLVVEESEPESHEDYMTRLTYATRT
jgi:hypothetical protein